MLLVSLVEAGIMGLDDPVHKWLSFWPDATADSRSRITLRHCLAFTTGYVDHSYGGSGCLGLGCVDRFAQAPAMAAAHQRHPLQNVYTEMPIYPQPSSAVSLCLSNLSLSLHVSVSPPPRRSLSTRFVDRSTLDCAKLVLDTKPHDHPAGTHFAYNSEHYRIAAAMAVAAAGRPLMELIEDYIFERTLPPMRSTTFADPGNPNLASEMTTTAEDYQAFFSSYFNGVLVRWPAQKREG